MTRPSPSGSTSMSPASARRHLRLRTWERGAGLTLACGTGACATAVAAIVQKQRHVAGAGGDEGRLADHRLGAGRADPDARRRRPTCSPARSTWRRSPDGRRDDHARLPAQLRRERDDARGSRPTGDMIIVNSCAVTNEAVRQTRQAIRRARRERPEARIVVTGCAAQLDPADVRGDARGRPGGRQCREISRARSFAQAR